MNDHDIMMDEYDSRYDLQEPNSYWLDDADFWDDEPNPYNGDYSEE